MVTPENADFLSANLNDSFDVFGLNKDVYLVRVGTDLKLLKIFESIFVYS